MQEKTTLLAMILAKHVCFGEIITQTFSEKSYIKDGYKRWVDHIVFDTLLKVQRLTPSLILRPSLSWYKIFANNVPDAARNLHSDWKWVFCV